MYAELDYLVAKHLKLLWLWGMPAWPLNLGGIWPKLDLIADFQYGFGQV